MAPPRTRADARYLTPCPIHGCGQARYPHALLCWEHLCQLPPELRTALEHAEASDRTGPTHLDAAKRALYWFDREEAA